MKYLKTYEELSPEYLVGKAGNRNTPQEQRILQKKIVNLYN